MKFAGRMEIQFKSIQNNEKSNSNIKLNENGEKLLIKKENWCQLVLSVNYSSF